MDSLSALLTEFGKKRGSRHWVGPRPEGEFEQVALRIAANLGYPSCVHHEFGATSFVKAHRDTAAELLAFFSRTSLAHGGKNVPEELRERSNQALADLKKGALFYTNGQWLDRVRGWHPLSNASFDGGVVGFDYENAFIYWVEEED